MLVVGLAAPITLVAERREPPGRPNPTTKHQPSKTRQKIQTNMPLIS